jgi:hypothetical protein
MCQKKSTQWSDTSIVCPKKAHDELWLRRVPKKWHTKKKGYIKVWLHRMPKKAHNEVWVRRVPDRKHTAKYRARAEIQFSGSDRFGKVKRTPYKFKHIFKLMSTEWIAQTIISWISQLLVICRYTHTSGK